MLDASQFVAAVEKRQGLKIGCIEEIAHFHGWISDSELLELAKPLSKNAYGQYLKSLVK